jgi:hypothetical protein
LDIYLAVLEKYLGHRPRVFLPDLDNFLEYRPEKNKYQVIYDRLFNRVFDNSKISQYIDTESFIRIDLGLVNCLKTFLKNPQFKYIDWKMMAKMDRQTGERTSIEEIEGKKSKIKYLIWRYLWKFLLPKM